MLSGSLNQRPFKRVFNVTIGSAAGQVNLVHNLDTEDFSYKIREDVTGNIITAPIFSVNSNTAAIDINGTSRDVIITILG